MPEVGTGILRTDAFTGARINERYGLVTTVTFQAGAASANISSMRQILHSISLLLASSAVVILFVDMPYVLLEHWHMLPQQLDSPLIFLTFPIVIAWMHAGFAILVSVVICESFVVDLKTASRRTKMAAGIRIGLCLMAFLSITIGDQLNLH